jgi:hypothetical protein
MPAEALKPVDVNDVWLIYLLRLRVEDMKNAPGCRMEWIKLMSEAADALERHQPNKESELCPQKP